MLSILLHTQIDAVRGRACVYMYRRDRYFILVLYILKNLQFPLQCIISLPCYPVQLQLIKLYIII